MTKTYPIYKSTEEEVEEFERTQRELHNKKREKAFWEP